MGWTRNYANILRTFAIPYAATGASGTSSISSFGFNDSSPWSAKTPDGTLRSIGVSRGGTNAGFFTVSDGSGATAKDISVSSDDPVENLSQSSAIYFKFGGKNFIYLGTDDTEESYEDYKLGSILPCTGSQQNKSFVNNGDGTFSVSYELVVVPQESGTIKEFGIYSGLYVYNYTANMSAYTMMMMPLVYRKVLSEGITATAGTPLKLQFTINIPKLSIE